MSILTEQNGKRKKKAVTDSKYATSASHVESSDTVCNFQLGLIFNHVIKSLS